MERTLQKSDREMSVLQKQSQGETKWCEEGWAGSGEIRSMVLLSSFGAKVGSKKATASSSNSDQGWQRNLQKR